MMLADMGADVLLVDRPSGSDLGLGHQRRHEVMLRGRRSVTLDLKSADGAAAALRLAERADAIVEGFRPGVMERLGLGPEAVLARNPKLVYGRMTGWGQEGPLAARAGHDINYIALVGRAARDRPGRRGAGAAAQPGRRLRRRRHAARLRHRLRRDRGAHERPRPGRRRGDGRRRVAARDHVLRHARRRQLARGARRQHPRHRRALVRQLRDRATASSSRSARSSRSSTPSCCARLGLDPADAAEAARPRRLAARCASASPRAFSGPQPRRVVRRLRRLRRLLRAGAHRSPSRAAIRTSRRAPATIELGRHRPAGAGAALRSHPGRGAAAAAGARRRRRRGAAPTGASTPRRSRICGRSASASRAERCSSAARPRDQILSRRLERQRPLAVALGATPSSRSFSRWAVSERSAIGCSARRHVGIDPLEQRRARRRRQRAAARRAPWPRDRADARSPSPSPARGSAMRKPWPGASQSRSSASSERSDSM